jgi:hypothetical protein
MVFGILEEQVAPDNPGRLRFSKIGGKQPRHI